MKPFTEKGLAIINSYIANPNQKLKDIGAKYGISKTHTSVIITKYFASLKEKTDETY